MNQANARRRAQAVYSTVTAARQLLAGKSKEEKAKTIVTVRTDKQWLIDEIPVISRMLKMPVTNL